MFNLLLVEFIVIVKKPVRQGMQFLQKYPKFKYSLVALDYSILALSFFIALKVKFWPHLDIINNMDYFIHPLYWTALLFSLPAILVFQYNHLYKKHIFITIVQQEVLLLKSIVIIFSIFTILSFFIKVPDLVIQSRTVIVAAALSSFGLLSFFRVLIARTVYVTVSKNALVRRKIVIVGAGQSGKLVAANLATDQKYGYELIGFLDDFLPVGSRVFAHYRNLGKIRDIQKIVQFYDIDEIIVCISTVTHARLLEIIETCKKTGKLVQVYSDLYELVAQKVPVERFRDFPFVRFVEAYNANLNNAFKRLLDIIFSSIAIVIASPIMLVIAVAIKMDSKGPVIFKQKRLGKDGKPFMFYKFRSMYTDVDDKIHREYLKNLIKNGKAAENGGKEGVYKIVDDPRITRVGRFIRKTSLDELPQLFNVLKGDMSLVGPRPGLPYEFEEYEEWHKERIKVLPGITGLWQVSGRNALTFEDMIVLDLYYIENMSPWFDLQIMLKTIPVLVFGDKHAF